MKNFQTIRQTAVTTSIPEHRIRQWVKQGRTPGFHAGSRFYVNVPLFLAKINEGRMDESQGGGARAD